MNTIPQGEEGADSTLRDMYDHIFHPERVKEDVDQRTRLLLKGGALLALAGFITGIGLQGCARPEEGSGGSEAEEEVVESLEGKLEELLYKALGELNETRFERSLKTLEEAEALWGEIESLKGNPSIKRRIDCTRTRALARKATIAHSRKEAAELYLQAYEIADQVKNDDMGPGAKEDLMREMDQIAKMLEERWGE
ncbi:MAG: hypothetical protein US89_C0015G0036 [Candidatus Peregrinibacteria bacterium GW2011_GWF2_38_29]|nr:MAG: hypothetical protein US89_C0015G0036 [Candidatus Peregrinibacteria bacterium GW2011_GWF2_38_29]HBB02302.1 hypothetical protein [Candidatus Peregrinibacteria bacterium]